MGWDGILYYPGCGIPCDEIDYCVIRYGGIIVGWDDTLHPRDGKIKYVGITKFYRSSLKTNCHSYLLRLPSLVGRKPDVLRLSMTMACNIKNTPHKLHCIRRTYHGALRLVISFEPGREKTRRVQSRLCRVRGQRLHMTMACTIMTAPLPVVSRKGCKVNAPPPPSFNQIFLHSLSCHV